VSEAAFDLEEVDRVEAGAHACLAKRRLSHVDDEHLRRITLAWNVDRSALEQIGFVQCALAAQQIGSPEDSAWTQAFEWQKSLVGASLDAPRTAAINLIARIVSPSAASAARAR